jgi:hypothetical protein
MRSPYCLCVPPQQLLNAVWQDAWKPEEMAVASQWLGKYVPMTTNTRTTIEELLDTVFSVWFMLYQRKEIINSSQNFLCI